MVITVELHSQRECMGSSRRFDDVRTVRVEVETVEIVETVETVETPEQQLQLQRRRRRSVPRHRIDAVARASAASSTPRSAFSTPEVAAAAEVVMEPVVKPPLAASLLLPTAAIAALLRSVRRWSQTAMRGARA